MAVLLYGTIALFLTGVFVILGDAFLEHQERRLREARRQLDAYERRVREQRQAATWPERDAA